MPQEGKSQVVVAHLGLNTGEVRGIAVEMGARNNAVRLLSVHYAIDIDNANNQLQLAIALSSNPEHLLLPPTTFRNHIIDKALYGLYSRHIFRIVNSSIGVERIIEESVIIPLHGLIRPRRQILVASFNQTNAVVELRAEVYYIPVELDKADLENLNLKYGKYRRHG